MIAEDMEAFSNKLVTEIFCCDNCKKLLKTPIMIVDQVGDLCNACYVNMGLESGLPNTKLEKVLKELIVPCSFKSMGCKESILFVDLEEHEKNCKFQIKKCLFSDECQWEGIQTDLSDHYSEKHPDHVLNGPLGLFAIDITLDDIQPIIKLLISEQNNYIIKIIKDEPTNSLLYGIYYINVNEHEHKCTIKHIGENTNYIETECELFPIKNINDGKISGKINLTALEQVTETTEFVIIKITLTNPNKLKELDPNMLQYFECPVCKNLMKPPIYQCKFGHSVCNVCKPKLEKCPTCRGVFGNTRNYALEGMTTEIHYACTYQHLGCHERLTSSQTTKHESVCIYKPYPCPLNDCRFTGNHKNIITHLESLHLDQVIFKNYYKATVDFRLEQLMDIFNYTQRYLMIFDENIFRLSFKRNSDYGFWAVEALRKHDENDVYIYEIGIIDMRRPDRKLIRTDLCFNETNTDELFKKCILFPNNTLASYANNGMFTYYCQITKRS